MGYDQLTFQTADVHIDIVFAWAEICFSEIDKMSEESANHLFSKCKASKNEVVQKFGDCISQTYKYHPKLPQREEKSEVGAGQNTPPTSNSQRVESSKSQQMMTFSEVFFEPPKNDINTNIPETTTSDLQRFIQTYLQSLTNSWANLLAPPIVREIANLPSRCFGPGFNFTPEQEAPSNSDLDGQAVGLPYLPDLPAGPPPPLLHMPVYDLADNDRTEAAESRQQEQ